MLPWFLRERLLLFACEAIRLERGAKGLIPPGTLPLLLQVASSLAYFSLQWKYLKLTHWLSCRAFQFTLLADLDDNLRGSVHLVVTPIRRTPYLFFF